MGWFSEADVAELKKRGVVIEDNLPGVAIKRVVKSDMGNPISLCKTAKAAPRDDTCPDCFQPRGLRHIYNCHPKPKPMGPCQSLWIPNWTPALLNQVMRGHWSNGGRLKKADKDIVAFYFSQAGLTKATGPRRVSMVFILPKGKRMFDRDAPWKSAKDALAACGALLEDTPRLCIDGPVSYARAIGAESVVGTLICLEDI